MLQEPVIIQDFIGNLAPGANESSEDIPCVGQVLVYGLAYSDAAATLEISQGVNDLGGVKQYRHTVSIPIAALTAEPFQVLVYGKFVKTNIVAGLGAANVEVFAALRSLD